MSITQNLFLFLAPNNHSSGSHDYVGDPLQSELLKKKLEQAGVVSKMIVYPNEGHGWPGKNLTDSFDKIVKFLNDNIISKQVNKQSLMQKFIFYNFLGNYILVGTSWEIIYKQKAKI